MNRIKVFGYNSCPYCSELIDKFKTNNIEFTYYDIETDEGEIEYDKIVKISKSEYVPLIVVNKYILTPENSFDTIDKAYEITVKLLSAS